MLQPWIWFAVAVAVIAIVVVLLLVVRARRRGGAPLPASPPMRGAQEGEADDMRSSAPTAQPHPGAAPAPDSAHEVTGTWPYDEPVEDASETAPPTALGAERPEASATRLTRLRARLAGSSSGLGKALLAILSRDRLTDEDWDELEEALLIADVGAEATGRIVDEVRRKMRIENASSAMRAKELLREQLIHELHIDASRDLALHGQKGEDGRDLPGVMLVVGVNGSGKTTTIGRIARLAVADGTTVLLGAADTFRAAAAEQLTTWGERVGVDVVRGPEGCDPASVAFDAVQQGIERGVDCVIVDTAGRLQNKTNLMNELGKIAKVAGRQAPITETLLVLDATTGQNGLNQGRVFAEVAHVSGIVLTKLDGSAKGGVVIAVQQELGVPVKLVGLGEGPDDLAPFDPESFVDALLGE